MSQETIQLIRASDWQKQAPPDHDPVVDGLFDLGDKLCIIGGPKTFKTWFCLQLAICLSGGLPWLGFAIPKARRVLLIQAELRDTRFQARFGMVLNAMGEQVDVENLFIVNCRGVELTAAKILQAAKECKAEIIILDPLYKLIEGDENSAKDMKVTLAMFDKLAEETRASIAYTHHDGKGNSERRHTRDRGAGSNVLARDYDCCITLTQHEQGDLQVAHFLLRNYPEHLPLSLRWKDYLHFVTDDVPRVKTRSNRNPTTDKPNHAFFATAEQILKQSRWKNKGLFIDALRSEFGVTKPKAEQIIEAAVTAGRIVTNHGKQLRQKQIIYACTQKDLDYAIRSISGA